MQTLIAEWKVIRALLERQKEHFNSDPAFAPTRSDLQTHVGRMINQIDQLLRAYDAQGS